MGKMYPVVTLNFGAEADPAVRGDSAYAIFRLTRCIHDIKQWTMKDKLNLMGHNWVHFAHSVLLPWIQILLSLKNLKLFSNNVKELFEPIV